MKSIIIILMLIFLTGCTREKEIYNIPNGYEGTVVIFFNIPHGNPPKYDEDGYRVYDIGEDGILKSQFSDNDGTILSTLIKYYYVENSKVVKELYYDHDIAYKTKDNVAPDSLLIFARIVGSGTLETKDEVSYLSFLVGKSRDANTLFNRRYNVFLPGYVESSFKK